MRIGLYGLPGAGKTFLLKKIDFMDVMYGSDLIREIASDFDSRDEDGKRIVREELASSLLQKDGFIMDGHYSFGEQPAFTDKDGELYDVFVYLYVNPDIIRRRMRNSKKNIRYLDYEIEKWQQDEIKGLRAYCHQKNKDFYVIDEPLKGFPEDTEEIIRFIKAVKNGYSCVAYAMECANAILKIEPGDAVNLTDGDKTIILEDSSYMAFGYTTHLFDGNFYSGYQSWRQNEGFEQMEYKQMEKLPIHFNKRIMDRLDCHTYIVTSGYGKVWKHISEYTGFPFFYGNQMSAETKLYITKFLQQAGKIVTAYGDSKNDYYMLKQADKGYLVAKQDGTVSKSLKDENLGGIGIV